MIKRALILDTETTSAESSGQVLEIGLILYSLAAQTTLMQLSALLPDRAENPAERINRIPVAALTEWSAVNIDTHQVALSMLAASDVVVAHNAEFDQQFFTGLWREKPWLCTCFDFRWPHATKEAEGFVHLALAHGIGVSSAHRALADCQLIASLFGRMQNLEGMFEHAMRPKALVQALVSYDERTRAKDAGFKWDPDYKRWIRRMALDDAALLPFKTHVLSAAGGPPR